ncbi:meristematic receptor-like kinase [Striga hermonthica]|uniref:Meristematic receptor-like kinase n=1 Tax=Striga hermonthica TaxID=68872 RepID=A0A9N7NT15_STRHE|nr:meristematic receptor-like kinase [Striga hermonthica]
MLLFYLFTFIFLDFSLVSCKQSDNMPLTESDYRALTSMKAQLIDLNRALISWNGTRARTCSSWAGIKCVTGRVTSIQLPWKGLQGRISESIGQLRALRHLSVHDNGLVGSIPTSIGLLRNLKGVYLFNNRLSGLVPPSIGNCLNLLAIDLSNNRLTGFIPPNLANLTRLYRINLSRNLIAGLLPNELGSLSRLNFLDLSNNTLDGEIPVFLFEKMANLSVLNLSDNNFTGQIPDTIGNNNVSSLTSLDLSRNNLTGEIPVSIANIKNLSSFDVSYNDLFGPVPPVLAKKFNSTSFIGNIQLCGYSFSTLCASSSQEPGNNPPFTSQQAQQNHHKLRKNLIFISASALFLVVILILCCILLCFCLMMRKKRADKSGNSEPMPAGSSEPEMGGKLVHFDGPFVFTADDLLCATAEIMGKSAYGTAYKATLEDGNQVTVKRLREKMTKARKEFEIEIGQLGQIRHPNILALRAYYLGPKGEKLLVYDHMPNGSLASFLHARGPETIISWPTRLSIAIGTSRALHHLHDKENIIHGNLTSTNILLDEKNNPRLAEFGLPRLVTGPASSELVATAGTTGYRAPELSKPNKNPTAKSDVYSLGVIILELLTGKSPVETDEDGPGLPEWVASIVKEEWTNEVFDVELLGEAGSDVGDELLNVLKLGLHCVDPTPGARPDAKQVMEKLEEVRPCLNDSVEEVRPGPKE